MQAGVAAGLLGGWLVDRSRRWHILLALYLLWQGMSVLSFTVVTNFNQLLLASLAWGMVTSYIMTYTSSSSSSAQCNFMSNSTASAKENVIMRGAASHTEAYHEGGGDTDDTEVVKRSVQPK